MKSQIHCFNKDIHKMVLHEELIAEPQTDSIGIEHEEFQCLPLRVLRVPGGWIYYNTYATGGGVFVPINYEFPNEEHRRLMAEAGRDCGH